MFPYAQKLIAVAAVLGVASASCVDPVNADAEAALGPEAPGVSEGPLHRPGQPCLTCHGEVGPGSPKMAVGGTVFASADDGAAGLGGVTVKLVDATGHVEERITNSVGNFYVMLEEWQPVWPLQASLSKNGYAASAMATLINGRTGCATCHKGSAYTTRSLPKLSLSESAK